MNPVRWRSVAGWAVLVGLLWLLGGSMGLLIGLAIVAYDLVRAPQPRELLLGAVLLFALVPLVVLVHGLPTGATLTPEWVSRNLVAHYLAGSGLALLLLGTLRDVRREIAEDRAPERVRAGEPRPPGDSAPR
jgi:hypothetical protein